MRRGGCALYYPLLSALPHVHARTLLLLTGLGARSKEIPGLASLADLEFTFREQKSGQQEVQVKKTLFFKTKLPRDPTVIDGEYSLHGC